MKLLHLSKYAGAALALSLVVGCADEEPPPEILAPVVVMQVAHSGAFNERWFPGRAKATRDANIAFEVPGRVIERPVYVGDKVEKGQLLAKLDPRDYQNALAEARAARSRALAFRDRVVQAAQKGAVSRQEVTDAKASLDAITAEVAIRTKALEDSELYAPFDGTVSAILVENFENVQAKQVIMRVLDTAMIELVVDIPESVISNVPHVKDLRVRFASFPDREFPARIIEVSNEASVATRTYPVNLLIDQPEDVEILPGMGGEATGRVELPGVEGEEEGHQVSLSALATDDNRKSFVWVVDPETKIVSRRDVELGETTSHGVMVHGLARGEWVATTGTHALSEGTKVHILESGQSG